jgi:hypothetical protein
MISKVETTTVLLRIPEDMKAWLEKQAALTLASRNNEILRCIRSRMDTERRERAVG